MPHLLDSLLAVIGGIDHQTRCAQDLEGNLAVELVILDEKHLLAAHINLLRCGREGVKSTGIYLVFLLTIDFKVQRNDKLGALALLAFKMDGAVHDVDQVLHDGKAQTRAAHRHTRGLRLSRKGLKDVALELLGDAHAVVAYTKDEVRVLRGTQGALLDCKPHLATRGRELHRIAQDVHQDLLELDLITNHVGVSQVVKAANQLDAGVGRVSGGYGLQVLKNRR